MSAKWQEAGTLPNFLSVPSFYVVKRFMDFSAAGGFGGDFKKKNYLFTLLPEV